jgi:N6-L-threonylcarbamoyladenine synthase
VIVLGIESSCDETAAALIQDGKKILSSVIASQVDTHRQFGGVVPELASREHVDNICYVVDSALREAGVSWDSIDAVAVTRGPGLVGALLVGLSYAKALAFSKGIPFLGVNHLEGHIYSIFLENPEAEIPALSLVVSGGHTNLYHLRQIGEYELLAKTRDDAAGEALDKISKHLGLGYPGGPVIERLSHFGNPKKVPFTIPKITDRSIDFSFSGIKTAAIRHLQASEMRELDEEMAKHPDRIPQNALDLVASFQSSIIEQIINRLSKAMEQRHCRSIQVSGGVSCNKTLQDAITRHFENRKIPVYFPSRSLTTDNAAMIAAAGYLRLSEGQSDRWDLPVNPNLRINSR